MKNGECVSCGRIPGRRYDVCPYCGEAVWYSLAFRILRVAIPIIGLGAFAAFLYLNLEPFTLKPLTASRGFLLAAGILASLWPWDDGDRILTSKRDWLRFHLGGALLQLVLFLIVLVRLGYPRLNWATDWPLVAALAACPYLYGLPVRALLGYTLLLAACAI